MADVRKIEAAIKTLERTGDDIDRAMQGGKASQNYVLPLEIPPELLPYLRTFVDSARDRMEQQIKGLV